MLHKSQLGLFIVPVCLITLIYSFWMFNPKEYPSREDLASYSSLQLELLANEEPQLSDNNIPESSSTQVNSSENSETAVTSSPPINDFPTLTHLVNSDSSENPTLADLLDQDGTFKMLKDVGEPYMDYFGLNESDFKSMAVAGVKVIESNFDICAYDVDVRYFLDESHKVGIKVILPAGSGEAEWGYACNVTPDPVQKPAWEETRVTEWVNKWKTHPALYAWDISNEAGGNFPNAADPANFLTLDQIKQAYKDVTAADPTHPVMIRMIGWFFYDYDQPNQYFQSQNPFAAGVADIVMINAYSNVEEYFPDFVSTVVSRARSSLKEIDPHVEIIIALGAWREPPLWYLPSVEHLQNDVNQAKSFKDILGVGFFKFGAAGSEWYLPDPVIGSPTIWQEIKNIDVAS